jgi:hypothetical protein
MSRDGFCSHNAGVTPGHGFPIGVGLLLDMKAVSKGVVLHHPLGPSLRDHRKVRPLCSLLRGLQPPTIIPLRPLLLIACQHVSEGFRFDSLKGLRCDDASGKGGYRERWLAHSIDGGLKAVHRLAGLSKVPPFCLPVVGSPKRADKLTLKTAGLGIDQFGIGNAHVIGDRTAG